MAVCRYFDLVSGPLPQDSDGQMTVEAFTVLSVGNKLCRSIMERRFGLHREALKYVPTATEAFFGAKPAGHGPGVVTTGAGPCLVAILHDIAGSQGCLGHFTVTSREASTFSYTTQVIKAMAKVLAQPSNLQLLLLAGNSVYLTYAHVAAQAFPTWKIDNLTTRGEAKNFVYFPKHDAVFRVERPTADGLVDVPDPPSLRFSDPNIYSQPEVVVDFSNFWSDAARTK